MSNAQPVTTPEIKGGSVFYPRKYFVNPSSDDLSFAVGVDIKGKMMVVYLLPTEEAKSNARDSNTAQSVPTFSEFSQTHRKAMHPCFASEENCFNTPCGVMLLEQLTPYVDCPVGHEHPVFKCKWASILREMDDSPLVPIGYGYLEINSNKKYSDEVNELINRYKEIEADMKAGLVTNLIEADQKKMSLHGLIMGQKKKWFVSVILKNRELYPLTDVSESGFRAALTPHLLKYTEKGMYGGAMIRVRDGEKVISSLCCQCDMTYDYKETVVKPVDTTIGEFLAFDGRKIIREVGKNPALVVEIIPTQRINCGKLGNDKYGKDLSYARGGMQVPKTLKTYVSSEVHGDPLIDYKKEKKFLYSMVAVRVAEIHSAKGTGNLLVSAMHAFSSPIGNPFSIDRTGKPAYYLDNNEWEINRRQKLEKVG
ncbi:hypothetical protein D3C87_378590 [compost metagenome]